MRFALQHLQGDVHEQGEHQQDHAERQRQPEFALSGVERDGGGQGTRRAADVPADDHGRADLRDDVAEGGVMTAARAKRASRATAQAVRQADAPSVWAVRRTRGSTPWTAAADNAAAMGSAMHTSPTAIACQVYSHPSPPSGPRRNNSPNSSKAVTTVAPARPLLTCVKAARRPQNGRVARKKPSGSPMAHAITVAVTATFRVSTTTPVTSARPRPPPRGRRRSDGRGG